MKKIIAILVVLFCAAMVAAAPIRWLCNNNDTNTTITGSDVDGIIVGAANTIDVAGTVLGQSAFHLNGTSQYAQVNVPDIWSSARANLWTKHASNPVIGTTQYTRFGELCKKPTGGWYLFTGNSVEPNYNRDSVYRYDSNDLITWSNKILVLSGGDVNAWDKDIDVASCFQDTNGLWNLFYRGISATLVYRIGKATSADGTTFTKVTVDEVNVGMFSQFGTNFDFTGIILVDGTYYAYVNGSPTHGTQNIYTSTDLQTFTAYSGNPIFPVVSSPVQTSTILTGDYCSYIWRYGNYYYLLVPRDFNQTDATLYRHGIGLYRSTKSTFDANSRAFLGYPIVNDQLYDDDYLDTPSIPVTDVNRNAYASEFGDTLYCLYRGANFSSQSLASTSLSGLSSLQPRFHQFFGEKYSISCWVQFDTVNEAAASYDTRPDFNDANSWLTFTADVNGSAGNDIAIRYWAGTTGVPRITVVADNNISLRGGSSDTNDITLQRFKDLLDANATAAALIDTTITGDGNTLAKIFPTVSATFRSLTGGADAGGVYSSIFSVGSSASDATSVIRVTVNSTKWTLVVGNTSSQGSTTPIANTPYLVTVINNCDIVNLYVNGVFEANSTTALTNVVDDYYLYFGTATGPQYLDGYIWDYRIYPYDLSATEVKTLYRQGMGMRTARDWFGSNGELGK